VVSSFAEIDLVDLVPHLNLRLDRIGPDLLQSTPATAAVRWYFQNLDAADP
jgi:hypothetical protein